MVRRSVLAFTYLAIAMLVLSTTVAAHSSVVHDASGDIAAAAPRYLDIVHAKVTEQIGKGLFYFQTVNAEPVPDTPAGFVAWNWFIDVPGGLPVADYVFTVRFCSQTVQRACGPGPWHWESSENLLATGTMRLNAFEFKVDGATVKAFVDPVLFGDPASFKWFAASRDTPAASGKPSVDLAPDDGPTNRVPFDR